ncbi:MAG: A/G-specific adenine glycosylase, partial [Candidatus Limnocylindria bacterium]
MSARSRFRRALGRWYARHGRALPWRRTGDPYAVLLSEVMLQQTQVSRVALAYEGFLRRFPTLDALAAAPLGEVLRAWAGLGYNRRALNLHRAAVEVVARRGGRLPDDLDGLLSLPGIGPYTARAVLAFAFERDHGVLDTNAARVLARVEGRRLRPKEAQARADELVPPGSAWAWNQAMLDLGATVCVGRRPACERCPVAPWCGWRRAGLGEPDPAVGSAGVAGRQSTFEGSDRQGRG